MPQTREAIDHARAANVPIIVAINKIDKPNANPERVKRELTELDLMPEEWGGKTVTVEVSAKKKTEPRSAARDGAARQRHRRAEGESEATAPPARCSKPKLDKGRGPVATVLVQDGTLSVGDTFIAGPIVGRVRALIDDRGRPTKIGRAVDAGRSARPDRPAAAGRRVPGRRRRPRRARSRRSARSRRRTARSAPRAAASRSSRCRRRSPKAA